MTKRLILIRHAKSSWEDFDTPDKDRPLNARGVEAAHLVGGWLTARGYVPDQVLCSDAARTKETWENISGHFESDPVVQFLPELYLAEPVEMLRVLAKATADTVMIIGHNPGTGALAAGLAARRPTHPRFSKYPTAATTVLDFNVSEWKEPLAGQGVLVDFVVPRDL